MIERGFVTIATGSERYFKMARTLLYSYRLTSNDPHPFAIICDKENEYTKDFDDVVVLENCTSSYIDKLYLLKKSPYAENIFVDADCIAYQDLNTYWDVLSGEEDFTCLGENLPLCTKSGGWFNLEGVGQYKEKIQYIPNFHGGIYFIRPGSVCDQMFEICQYIVSHFNEFTFRSEKPADEPILALAMAICGCRTKKWKPYHFICFWNATLIKADFTKRYLEYSTRWFQHQKNGMLLHWGNVFTNKVLYKFEEEKVISEYKNQKDSLQYFLMYKCKVRLFMLYLLKVLEKL